MIKVLVADDQLMFLEVLVMFLREDKTLRITGEASHGGEALALAVKEKPDVVITDIEMPQMDGIALTKELLALYPDLPIIGLTVYEDDHLVADMFSAGAKGYLIKRCGREQVKDAIRIVHGKGYYFCKTTSAKLFKLIEGARRQGTLPVEPGTFSEAETKIIQLSCEGLSSHQIASQLHLGRRTVESYRHLIYQRLGIRNIAELITYAIRHGLYQP
jgi:DNA-binding NarL/FixJ family response regulator